MAESDSTGEADGGPSSGALIKRLLQRSWRFRGRCVQVLSTQTAMLALQLAGLNLVGVGVDFLNYRLGDGPVPRWPFGISPDPQVSAFRVMAVLSLVIGAMALLRTVLELVMNLSVARLVAHDVVPELRNAVFRKLQRLSFRFFDSHASGSIINRITSDVQAVRLFIDQVLITSLTVGISLVFYLVVMLRIHAGLTLACLATTPLLWVLAVRFSKRVRPAYLENRRLMDQLVLRFSENIQGMNTIKGYALEGRTASLFREDNTAVREQRSWIFRQISRFSPTVDGLTHLNLVILLLYGGYLVITGEIAVGTGILVFARILQEFSSQVASVAGITDAIQQSLTGARRVFEIIDTPVEVASPLQPRPLPRLRGEVAFDEVSFFYKQNNVALKAVSFTARPGEIIAIGGATGSGKSALISLIPRFYDPQEGAVRIDGVDIREYAVDELRRNIGLVFQENFLFSDTIRNNIAFGHPEATGAQVERAARIAAAHDFIRTMPDGYDSFLGEGGVNLSGGQRQRLAIARAVLLDPSILLLDDPTAAIDPEPEHEILEAIESAIRGRTTFIVAHRLATLKRADRILILDKGRLAQFGTHEELIAQDGLYRSSVSIQDIDPRSRELLRNPRQGGNP